MARIHEHNRHNVIANMSLLFDLFIIPDKYMNIGAYYDVPVACLVYSRATKLTRGT